MLKGTASGLEILLEGSSFEDAAREIERRLGERPSFYRGSKATAIVASLPDDDASFARFAQTLAGHGIDLRGVHGEAGLQALAARHGIAYLGPAPRESAPRLAVVERATRAAESAPLTVAARSLDADFAGARADFVKRRDRIVAARERGAPAVNVARGPVASIASAAAPATLYHRGHLRGGQSLQHPGTIVVFGDVNPGAELTAGGDIMIFGALHGTAHAGAQGDASARVIALTLLPTQLRIATSIAAGAGPRRSRSGLQPEVAFIDTADGAARIAIAPYDDVRVPR